MSQSPDNQSNFEQAGASDDSIRQVHAQLQRDKPEKKDGYAMLPLILLGVMCAAAFFGSIYIVHNSIRFDPLVVNYQANRAKPGVSGPVQASRAQLGKRIYTSNCMACHQATGMGIPGQYPPLAGSEWVAGTEERLVRIVLHGVNGPIKVLGQEYNNVMAPLGSVMKDDQIANVLSYVRAEWGNQFPEVQPETVAKVRADTAGHTGYWTEAELLKIGN